MNIHRRYFLFAIVCIFGCRNAEQTIPPERPSDTKIESPQQDDVPMTSEWPFEDAENTAVISLTRIMDGSSSILYVVHDEEGDWQFLDGGDVSEEDAAMVSLRRVADLDASIKTLADLPVGWAAERESADVAWERFQR